MSLFIFTQPPRMSLFSLEAWKRIARKVSTKSRGPDGVTRSLLSGLDALHHEYIFNSFSTPIKKGDTVWINESIDALRWAISEKNDDVKLIVGPNLVVSANDSNGIIGDSKIDIILQPSVWTRDFMSNTKPELRDKVRIWPAGVAIPEIKSESRSNDVLIFVKNISQQSLLSTILSKIKSYELSSECIYYGNFEQATYFSLLEKSKMMIYIGTSESQGLALQEAWARDVPTLVFDNGDYDYNGYHFSGEKISAPYLNESTGRFFNKEDFDSVFDQFLASKEHFKPRDYVEGNLSDIVCAKRFLEIAGSQ